MHTLIGFSESVDQAAAYVALNGLADPHVRVSGDDIQIPALNQVVLVAGLVENVAANRARLVSPSLRRRSNFQVTPLNGGAAAAVEPDSPHKIMDLRDNPLALVTGEQLNFEAFANPAAAQIQTGLVWLSDGKVAPISGPIFSVRATSATAAVADAWTNVAIAFEEDLPVGRYQVVGLFPMSTTMLAARLVLVGYQWRPGAMGSDLINDLASPIFRLGQMGVYGEFEDTSPPTIDVLCAAADATQEFWIDLIQVREGIGGA